MTDRVFGDVVVNERSVIYFGSSGQSRSSTHHGRKCLKSAQADDIGALIHVNVQNIDVDVVDSQRVIAAIKIDHDVSGGALDDEGAALQLTVEKDVCPRSSFHDIGASHAGALDGEIVGRFTNVVRQNSHGI